jgi:hypothetical protein
METWARRGRRGCSLLVTMAVTHNSRVSLVALIAAEFGRRLRLI